MSNEQNENSFLKQAILPITIAIIASGTSPWWWNEITKKNKPSNNEVVPELSHTLIPESHNSDEQATDINWTDSPKSLGIIDSTGHDFIFSCNSGQGSNRIWGTDVYTGDTSICEAAVHSGVINNNMGGQVVIKVLGSQESFLGTQKNGVLSQGYPNYSSSFQIIPTNN